MPASDEQVPNKQQPISSSTSANTTHATSPSTDSSSQDTKAPPSPAEAPATVRKRALLCGVTNKADPENRLKGSVNDVKRIKEMLIKQFGYPDNDECIRVLIEDDQEINGNELSTTSSTPTKKNIEDSLKWLVEGSKSGDKLVFFFSGHCQQQLSCRPHDSENMNTLNIGSTQTHDHVCLVCTGKSLIPNYDINSTIVRPLKEGITLYAIVDACFSGSILDLKYKYDQQRSNILRRSLIYLFVRDRLSIIGKFWLESCSSTSAEGCWTDNQSDDLSKAEKGTSGGLAICLSATDKGETAESNANSSEREILGAMTFNLIEMVKEHLAKNANVTYEDILKKMQELRDHVSCRNIERGPPLAPIPSESKLRRAHKEISRKIEVPVLSSSDRELKVSSQKFLL